MVCKLATGRALSKLGYDSRGSAAVEFALVAVPFFALVFAILETALIFWAGHVLEGAVESAARKVYTGEFQRANKGTTPADMPGKLKGEICKHVLDLFDCSSKLTVDLKAYTTFPPTVPNPIITAGNGSRSIDPNFGNYENAGPDQIVLIRAIVRYPVIAPLLGSTTSNFTANTRILLSSAAFRTEQYL